MGTYNDVQAEELHFRRVQLNQYAHAYHVTALCPPSVSGNAARNILTRAWLEAEEDADFHITRMSGSVVGPVDASAQLQTANVPDFLAPGVTAGRAERGLSLRIVNYSTGVDLTARYQDPQVGATLINNFIPVELLLTPGYGYTFYKPYEFEYYLPRTQKMLFEFRNRDQLNGADTGGFHRVTLTLIGQRIER